MTRDEILAATERQLQKRADELVAAYVFGSVARNTARPSSDVDLAILYRTEPPLTLSGLTSSERSNAIVQELASRM